MREDGTSRELRGSASASVPSAEASRALKERDRGSHECQAREVLDRVGDKWSIAVVVRLGQGTKRFSELRREIDRVTPRMLTVTLRSLARDGHVSRTVYPVVPPKVEYRLTQLGGTLLEAVRALKDWADEHLDDVHAAQRAYDASLPNAEASA